MTGEPMNSERWQADRFDALVDAAQASGPPENETVADLRALVEIGRSMRADETFARELEAQLVHLHRRKRSAGRGRWVRLAAAAALVVIIASIAFFARRDDQPSSTGGMAGTTPIALAATSTVAVEINQTQLAMITPTSSPEPVVLTVSPTGTTMATSTGLPTRTFGPIVTITPGFTATPPPTVMAPRGTPTPLALGTAPPASQAMTVVPAVNPTMVPTTEAIIQLDVLLVIAADEIPTGDFDSPPNTRFGLVMVGDETLDFTRDLAVLQTALQAAEPVDITPDALSTALAGAVSGVNWSPRTTGKLIILVTDVAPSAGISSVIQAAVTRGISIHVVSPGELTVSGESVLRQMTTATGGQLIKMTDSNDTVDDLIAGLLADELADQREA